MLTRSIIIEKAASGSGEHHARLAILNAKPQTRRLCVASQHNYSPAAHVLFLDDHLCHAGPGEIAKRLVRVLQKAGAL